ncbi:GIY-YIG nuclease family protein [Variovorax saccharolyticus]|uniref:GIY-YIG nuclease family protein n=1 Tax=Variovorax saccharolyticus TaxID=3053516 RepID=UPI002576EED2|nr:GIY-YIG nuclease family protein [Variovorax sp. J22R187]MDM0018366.1 GIY-YIG nuclease family protein [Variovorax sp. J22R187]
MDFVFEPTRSFCYKFGRYTVIPEVEAMPEVSNGVEFRLKDLAQLVIDKYLTEDQQQLRIKKAHSDRTDPIHSIVKFFVAFLVMEQELFVPFGKGIFRAKTAADITDDEIEEAALEEGDDEAAEFEGWIYAFSFPVLVRQDEPFPIKVGKTLNDVAGRVAQQCKGAASFDNPVILGRWQVNRVGHTELAVHNVLKARGKWRENVPGIEWFDTTPAEVEAILGFVTSG